jgi:hypothetical protein
MASDTEDLQQAQVRCMQFGHDLEVVESSIGEPVRVICTSCDRSWPVGDPIST